MHERRRYAPESLSAAAKQGGLEYALRRFNDETNRLYGVLNNRLYDRPYLAHYAKSRHEHLTKRYFTPPARPEYLLY